MRETLIFILSALCVYSQIKVVSHLPSKNELGVIIGTSINIDFDKSIDPASINDTTFMVYGRWTGVHSGEIIFKDDNTVLEFVPDKTFNAGEMVTVSLSKNISDDSGNSAETGYTFQYIVESAEGTFQLTKDYNLTVRNRNEGHIQVYGAFAGDLNEDGYTDFTVPNEVSNDIRVFLNDGTGRYNDFQIYQLDAGSQPSTNEGADFNLDGHIDFAVGNAHNNYVSIFFGNGNGQFVSQDVYDVGHEIRGLTVIDLDSDGHTDIVTANRDSDDLILMRNNGEGKFLDITSIDANTENETACMSGDANGDGILDLFVGSHNGEAICLLLGDGKGNLTFSDKIDVGGKTWMVVSGDVNGDGFSDVVSANSYDNNFSVSFSNGDGTLDQSTVYPSGNFPIAIDLGDLDGDNDLDLVLSNFSDSNFEIYENDGTGNFTLVNKLLAPSAGSCAVLHDRDNDGDLDMTGIDEIADVLVLFDNDPGVVSAGNLEILPEQPVLYQNYPNPFNPSTIIKFTIPTLKTNRDSSLKAKLVVYDILGRETVTLLDKKLQPGNHSVKINAELLPSGVYFYKLNVDNRFISLKKMILLK